MISNGNKKRPVIILNKRTSICLRQRDRVVAFWSGMRSLVPQHGSAVKTVAGALNPCA